MKNIMITGGAGFIGSHVVRLFVNKYPEYHPVSAPGNHEDLNLITYVKTVLIMMLDKPLTLQSFRRNLIGNRLCCLRKALRIL
ncbi:NAD-dependent epimerase/dehydratase family protein [Segatella copri]|uniref:NAD-dependent epimerase/dehydratase family protein n=1 Tax=Segatella copri TaxID=165179 RepID=UPI001C44C7F4|nr:NAD-dependent epimerase/dehydratase family protein [Segatella copri]